MSIQSVEWRDGQLSWVCKRADMGERRGGVPCHSCSLLCEKCTWIVYNPGWLWGGVSLPEDLALTLTSLSTRWSDWALNSVARLVVIFNVVEMLVWFKRAAIGADLALEGCQEKAAHLFCLHPLHWINLILAPPLAFRSLSLSLTWPFWNSEGWENVFVFFACCCIMDLMWCLRWGGVWKSPSPVICLCTLCSSPSWVEKVGRGCNVIALR